jgi:hypothetical protein
MKSRIIEVNGVEVTCYEDGSIEKIDGNTGATRRQFGSNCNGYMVVNIRCEKYYIHRMMVEAFTGRIGDGHEVDHADGNRSNNSISNLRAMSHHDNLKAFRLKGDSSTSMFRGVSASLTKGKWLARCQMNGKQSHIGSFDSEEAAAKAFDEAAVKNGYVKEALNFHK